MLVYLDESYQQKEKLFLGTLFIPVKSEKKYLHKGLLDIKISNGFTTATGIPKEIKYNKVRQQKHLNIAKQAIKLFFESDSAFFRACVIPYDEEELKRVGRQRGIPIKLKEAMLYTKAVEQLIKNNISGVRRGVLLMDEITRARGDRFNEMIQAKLGSGSNPIFRHISYIKSHAPQNHTIQICDLLLGAVLNEHYPAQNQLKNEVREIVKQYLNTPTLKESYWKNKSQKWVEEKHPKFTIRYWGIPYQYLSL
jgi:hypothetical protein